MYGGSYITHTGGPTLEINTNGLTTFGIFLDPNGSVLASNTDIRGRLFSNVGTSSRVGKSPEISGFNIVAPVTPTPEPAGVLLMATGMLGFSAVGFRRLRNKKS